MQKQLLIIGVLVTLLVACNSLPPKTDLKVPTQINYQQQTYYLQGQQDLGNIARFVYLKKDENLQNWQSAVELLLDRNLTKQSLAQRLALRQRVYKNTGVKNANLFIENQQLLGSIIFPPSEKYQDWQVDVVQGKNVAGCGFMQYQYSLKFPKTQTLEFLLKASVPDQLNHIQQQNWHWGCK